MKHLLLVCLTISAFTSWDITQVEAAQRPMAAKLSVNQLKSACTAAKGIFRLVTGPAGGAECTKNDCAGPETSCVVTCDKSKKCTADTPALIVGPTTVVGILQNGNMTVRGDVEPSNRSLVEGNDGPSELPIFVP